MGLHWQMFCIFDTDANDILSIYEETDYDYIIKNPSADQITSFGENTSIKKVVPYYQLAYTFEIANEDIELTLKSIDNEQDLNFTEFSKTRLVEEQNISGNKIYLDYNLATRCGLKIGDTIGSNAMQFVVAGFYKNYDAQLAFVPNLKNIIQSSLSCAGVYVEVENITEFNASVVQGYKPLATLKGRESFSDDAAYQAYLNDFNSRDYSAYIIEKNVGYAEAKESYDNKIAEAKIINEIKPASKKPCMDVDGTWPNSVPAFHEVYSYGRYYNCLQGIPL